MGAYLLIWVLAGVVVVEPRADFDDCRAAARDLLAGRPDVEILITCEPDDSKEI